MEKPIYFQVPLQPITPNRLNNLQHSKAKQVDTTFSQHFNEAISNKSNHLKISKHASERLQQRGINIDSNLWDKIGSKVIEAKNKGVNESLVLVNDAALIVSAKNETVITAMNLQEATEQVFTNINGAIIVK